MRVLAADISAHQGQEITVSGWVHRIRNLGGVSFVMLRDRSGLVQVVYDSEPEFGNETVISVRGTVAENEKADGGFEVQAEETEVLGPAASDIPVA
nr:OB-fold nucleic acid binding domain-containing protein [Spirochaeta sp.]